MEGNAEGIIYLVLLVVGLIGVLLFSSGFSAALAGAEIIETQPLIVVGFVLIAIAVGFGGLLLKGSSGGGAV